MTWKDAEETRRNPKRDIRVKETQKRLKKDVKELQRRLGKDVKETQKRRKEDLKETCR